jgi:hypothetical protein
LSCDDFNPGYQLTINLFAKKRGVFRKRTGNAMSGAPRAGATTGDAGKIGDNGNQTAKRSWYFENQGFHGKGERKGDDIMLRTC